MLRKILKYLLSSGNKSQEMDQHERMNRIIRANVILDQEAGKVDRVTNIGSFNEQLLQRERDRAVFVEFRAEFLEGGNFQRKKVDEILARIGENDASREIYVKYSDMLKEFSEPSIIENIYRCEVEAKAIQSQNLLSREGAPSITKVVDRSGSLSTGEFNPWDDITHSVNFQFIKMIAHAVSTSNYTFDKPAPEVAEYVIKFASFLLYENQSPEEARDLVLRNLTLNNNFPTRITERLLDSHYVPKFVVDETKGNDSSVGYDKASRIKEYLVHQSLNNKVKVEKYQELQTYASGSDFDIVPRRYCQKLTPVEEIYLQVNNGMRFQEVDIVDLTNSFNAARQGLRGTPVDVTPLYSFMLWIHDYVERECNLFRPGQITNDQHWVPLTPRLQEVIKECDDSQVGDRLLDYVNDPAAVNFLIKFLMALEKCRNKQKLLELKPQMRELEFLLVSDYTNARSLDLAIEEVSQFIISNLVRLKQGKVAASDPQIQVLDQIIDTFWEHSDNTASNLTSPKVTISDENSKVFVEIITPIKRVVPKTEQFKEVIKPNDWAQELIHLIKLQQLLEKDMDTIIRECLRAEHPGIIFATEFMTLASCPYTTDYINSLDSDSDSDVVHPVVQVDQNRDVPVPVPEVSSSTIELPFTMVSDTERIKLKSSAQYNPRPIDPNVAKDLDDAFRSIAQNGILLGQKSKGPGARMEISAPFFEFFSSFFLSEELITLFFSSDWVASIPTSFTFFVVFKSKVKKI